MNLFPPKNKKVIYEYSLLTSMENGHVFNFLILYNPFKVSGKTFISIRTCWRPSDISHIFLLQQYM